MVLYNNIAQGDLSFGLSLMSHLGEGNAPISPTSIRTALAMLYEGAKGATAKQIAQVAAIPEDTKKRWEGFRKLTDILNATNVPYTIKCANGLWIAGTYPVNEDTKKTLKDSYKAETHSANFRGNPEGERLGINKWVSKKTEEKIQQLFPAGSIYRDTVFVLANALYFKAMWDNKFDPQYTQKQDYTLSSGETVKVDMMRKGRIDSSGKLPKFHYGTFDGVQVAMIPYKGEQLQKIIMLPPSSANIRSLESELKGKGWSLRNFFHIMGPETREFARLELPKHEVRGSYDLVGPLTGMGIDRIFAVDTAELGGIGPGPLFVNAGRHETYFKTDEEGSEGAAATGFAMRCLGVSLPKAPVEFVANRPFLEAIVDFRTGAFLFLNRIEDPR